MEPALADVSPAVGKVSKALADSGYYSAEAVAAVEDGGRGKRHPHGRSVEQLEKREEPPAFPDARAGQSGPRMDACDHQLQPETPL